MSRTRIVPLVVAVIVATTGFTYAQTTPERPRPSAGAFWTANFATISLAPAVDGIAARQWLGGGLSVEIPVTRHWSLEGRAFWNRRGARLPVPGTSGYQDVSADYVSMPLLFKAAVGGAVRPYLLVGAEVGLRTRARVRTVVGAIDVEENAASFIRRTDVALDAGAGLERALPKARVFVEALYAHGLWNVAPDASGDATRTRTLTLLAGLRF